jgi:hypothetical protein
MDDRNALAAMIEAVEAGIGPPWRQVFGRDDTINAAKAYHGSLDAANALHEALLPGWSCAMNTNGSAQVIDPMWERFHGESQNNPARAWLLAVLRALAEKGE